MGKIQAPFTRQQVAALNQFQHSGKMHPFTCGKRGELHPDQEGILVARHDGWHCSAPGCTYRQFWAHDFMANGDQDRTHSELIDPVYGVPLTAVQAAVQRALQPPRWAEVHSDIRLDLTQHPMYRLVHESSLIENFDSVQADMLQLLAWERLGRVRSIEALTHEHIEIAQGYVTAFQTGLYLRARGEYRDVTGLEVRIAGRPGAPAKDVRRLMTGWVDALPEMDPIDAHVAFEMIHPFVDGNGRVGRLLLWWHEALLGKAFTVIEFEKREEYYGWFHD